MQPCAVAQQALVRLLSSYNDDGNTGRLRDEKIKSLKVRA